jgi:plasmid stabilization system protein ParE
MPALKRHPLVRADIEAAFNWYEDQQAGLGQDFLAELFAHYRRLPREAELYAVRFGGIRRMNLRRFPFGIFYVVRPEWIAILGVLHGSRDTEAVLAERRSNDTR